jgi:hypothetical protein
MENRRGAYRVLVGEPEGKEPSGRPRSRWEDNIKMDLQEVLCEGVDWIDLAQDRDRWRALVNGVMDFLIFLFYLFIFVLYFFTFVLLFYVLLSILRVPGSVLFLLVYITVLAFCGQV